MIFQLSFSRGYGYVVGGTVVGGDVFVGASGVQEGIRVRARVGRGRAVWAVQVTMTTGDAVSVGV